MTDDADTTKDARIAGLELAANMILLELTRERGKGPWFPGLLNRIQFEGVELEAPDGLSDEADKAYGNTVHRQIYDVFSRVLHDKTIPDFRQRAAISGNGVANPMLAPAVAAGYRILAERLVDVLRSTPDAEQTLRTVRADAIRKAEVQSIPSDAKGVLKDRWIGASITAIESVLSGRSDE